jgi:tetracycline resistance efflux pump
LETLGIITLLPALVAIVTAVLTHRPIESLLAGVIAGLLLLSPAQTIPNFSEILLAVVMDETVAWVIIVCGLIGSLIVLMMRSGAALAFSHALSSRARSRRGALLSTWLLGVLIFIDDYLNALSVGSSMRPVTDKQKVSREMLAYVVDSTAAPICMLIPISTWAVFFAGVLEESGVAADGEGLTLFISAIPYMLYPWFALLLVFLVAGGWFPAIGPMRKAEAFAARGELYSHAPAALESHEPTNTGRPAALYHFALPMLALIGFSVWYDIDVEIGVLMALLLTIVIFGVQRLLTWHQLFDSVLDGIKIMVPALTIIVMAFMFKTVNDQLGMPSYVIETISPWMTATTLPVLTFITLAFVSFATGSSWGIFVIAIPVVMPLGAAAGVDTTLMVGAVMSASAFGSHACFYSDATVLAAQGSGCSVMSHAITQIPYVLIAAGFAAVGLTLLS